jgi:hypothetical protein
MISLLHEHGGFAVVLAADAAVAFAMFALTVALAALVNTFERRHAITVAPLPAE